MTSFLSRQSNLPAQVSSFIGRERELAEVARLLQMHRLVTLTGAGGAGKTRLALHAASDELAEFSGGVWLVELAPLAAPDFVIGAIAKALKAPDATVNSPLDTLSVFLSEKRLLLVLDNCEHLLGECAHTVAHLLARCPALTVLATSREPLSISGETVLRVPPLTLPDSAQTAAHGDHEQLLQYDGVHLFVERAQAAEPSFHLTDVNAAAVVDICRRLDGIPLALELAAVRVRGMGVAYLDTRLDDRLRLLGGNGHTGEPRQRTLHALVDWSYSLLTEREQAVLRRLCVFVGSFSREATEAVCVGEYENAGRQEAGTSDDVLEDLMRLVDKSLVQFDQGAGRYRLLETIRLFGREQLDATGETQDVNRRHVLYYLALAEHGGSLIGGPRQMDWFARLELEHDNFRAALLWAIDAGRANEAATMALGLWRFWHARTYQREGLRWLERILALEATDSLPDALRARLLNALGVLAHRAARFDDARAYHAEALRIWTAAADQAGMAQALFDIGWQHFDQVDVESAKQRALESLSLAESVGDQRLIASAMLLAALADIQSAKAVSAIPDVERSLSIWRELEDTDNLATTLAVLAAAYQQIGDHERAKPPLAESVRLHIRLGSYGNLISTLVNLMHQAVGMSDHLEMAQDAARVCGMIHAWEEITSGISSPWWASEPGQAVLRKITRQLGQEAFERAVAEGKQLTTAGLLALTDRITAPSPRNELLAAQTVAGPATLLTPREIEVLRLVATGMTNAEVAGTLIITPRTVNAHLTAIYGKLGVASRSGAIRYALQHHLA